MNQFTRNSLTTQNETMKKKTESHKRWNKNSNRSLMHSFAHRNAVEIQNYFIPLATVLVFQSNNVQVLPNEISHRHILTSLYYTLIKKIDPLKCVNMHATSQIFKCIRESQDLDFMHSHWVALAVAKHNKQLRDIE